MRILFMGTPDFALPSLDALIHSQWNMVGVVTQPDRAKGRGFQIHPPPVKTMALKYQIPIFQPERVRQPEFIEKIKKTAPDLIVVVAFGQILPKSFLAIPELGCMNLHASLLPKYRGAAPIQWAIVHGEQETGITVISMNEAMDQGNILSQEKVQIGERETAGELAKKLSVRGASLIIKTIEALEGGRAKQTPQDHEKASYAPLLKKEDGKIKWENSAVQIYNFIRGMDPWPGAFTFLGPLRLRIVRAEVGPANWNDGRPGELKYIPLENLVVSTGKGTLNIIELQPSGKKKMPVKEFLSGHPLKKGMRFH